MSTQNKFIKFLEPLAKDNAQSILRKIAVVTLVLTVLVLAKNLFNNSFWLDESHPLFIAEGTTAWEPNGEATGITGIFHAYKRSGLADPPGFNYILNLWMAAFGSSTFALRALPFVFYLLLIFLAFRLGKRISDEPLLPWIAVCISLTPLFNFNLTYYAFELRPYSLEALTAFLFCFVLVWIYQSDKITVGHWLIQGLLGLMLFSAKYPVMVFVPSYGAMLIWICVKKVPHSSHKTKKNFLWATAIFFALACLITVLLGSFDGYLNKRVLFTGKQILSELPSYLNSLMFTDKSFLECLQIILANLISVTGIEIILALCILFFLRHRKNKQAPVLAMLLVFFACVTFSFIILSSIGAITWYMPARWNIQLVAAGLAIFIVAVVSLLKELSVRRKSYTALALIVTMPLALFTSAAFSRGMPNNDFNVLQANYTRFFTTPVLVAGASQATYRHFFEFGPGKFLGPNPSRKAITPAGLPDEPSFPASYKNFTIFGDTQRAINEAAYVFNSNGTFGSGEKLGDVKKINIVPRYLYKIAKMYTAPRNEQIIFGQDSGAKYLEAADAVPTVTGLSPIDGIVKLRFLNAENSDTLQGHLELSSVQVDGSKLQLSVNGVLVSTIILHNQKQLDIDFAINKSYISDVVDFLDITKAQADYADEVYYIATNDTINDRDKSAIEKDTTDTKNKTDIAKNIFTLKLEVVKPYGILDTTSQWQITSLIFN